MSKKKLSKLLALYLPYNPNAASCWVSVGGKIYELPGGTTTRFE